MMRGDKSLLYIHPSAHFGCGTEKDTNTARIHVAEQFCFSYIRVGIMDEGDFIGGNPLGHQLPFHILVHGKFP